VPEKPGIPAGPKQESVSVGLIEKKLLEAKLLLVSWLNLNALFVTSTQTCSSGSGASVAGQCRNAEFSAVGGC
jgi:hypothetical protein